MAGYWPSLALVQVGEKEERKSWPLAHSGVRKNIGGLNTGKREERPTIHGNLVQSLREENKLIFLRGKSSNEKEAQTK